MLALGFTLVSLAATIAGGVSDFRSLRIPNLCSLVIAGAFVGVMTSAPAGFLPWQSHLGAFLVMFIITFAMFFFNIMGSGDTKLASVLALWVGMKGLIIYLFYMSVFGGILGAASLFIRKNKPFKSPQPGGWIDQVQNGRNAVPYGIAIGFSAWITLLHTDFFIHILN